MGARRVMAARKCGLSTIGAIIQKSELSETEIVQLQFVENCQRESITPLAKASAIQRLMKLSGWSATRAASKLGLSNSAVTRLLSLLSLPDAIRAKIETGEITASAGYELARVGDSAGGER
jgi:ParB family chromosome partitioning protein